jgi:hypothetical protein
LINSLSMAKDVQEIPIKISTYAALQMLVTTPCCMAA